MIAETMGMMSMLVFEVSLGVSPLIYKFIDTSISESTIVAIRYGFSSVFLFLWLLLRGGFKKQTIFSSPKRIAGILFLGIIGSGVAAWWYAIAIRHVGVILSTLITNLEIPLGVFLGHRMLKEHISKTYLYIFAVILIGYILLTVKNGIELASGGSYVLGVGLSLGSAVIWSMCTIVGKKLMDHVSSAELSFWRLFFAVLTVSCIAWGQGELGLDALRNITMRDWLMLSWLGVVTSGMGLLMYYFALKVLSVKKISLFFPLSAVITVILGFAFGETPLLSQWIGIVLITGGMVYFFLNKNVR